MRGNFMIEVFDIPAELKHLKRLLKDGSGDLSHEQIDSVKAAIVEIEKINLEMGFGRKEVGRLPVVGKVKLS